MKTKLIAVIFLLSTAALFAGETLLSMFTAKSDGTAITVRWQPVSESNLQRYEIERSKGEDVYQRINTQVADGSPTYEYVDEEAFMKGAGGDRVQESSVYSYRIKIYRKDGSYDFSDVAYVTHNVSSIKKTWGMIKEMFR